MSAEREATVADKEREAESRCRRATGCVSVVVMEYLAVLRVRELRGRALVVFFCWFVASLVYYGISLNATNIRLGAIIYIDLQAISSISDSVALKLFSYVVSL